MEYKYYRELKHNYLIFKKESDESEDERYQNRIVESGRIAGLIPCSERKVNARTYFYYEIGSMQPLKDRYQSRGMSYEELRALLQDIRDLLTEMSEFLLGPEGLVFNESSIYTDLGSGRSRLIYCTFFDEEKSFSDFASQLLALVDDQDEKAVDLVYRLCEECVARGDFVYEILDSLLQDTVEENAEPQEELPSQIDRELWQEDFEEEEKEQEESHGRMKRAAKRLSGKMQLLFGLLFGLLVGAMVYIRMNYILTSEENILSILVMAVSAATGMAALAGGFLEIRKADRGRQMEDKAVKSEGRREPTEDFYEDSGDFGDVWPERNPEQETPASYRESIRVTGSFNRHEASSGETVLLDEDRAAGIALFSRNLDKTVRIPLDQLPLTVGKMESCVDKALSDSSVSRIHCRFEKGAQDKIFVRDLGSTNGTFKNGLRLSPQQLTPVDEGDEIRLGRVCFDCR